MTQETLNIVKSEFIQRLDELAIRDDDRLELMLMIHNLLTTPEEYKENCYALDVVKVKQLTRSVK